MVSLSDLPFDVTDIIFSKCSHDDLLQLSRVNKALYHGARHELWSSVELEWTFESANEDTQISPKTKGPRLDLLLGTLLKDPSLRPYIKNISLWSNMELDSFIIPRVPVAPAYKSLVLIALQESKLPDRERWESAILRGGSTGATFALLLWLCPNVESLRVHLDLLDDLEWVFIVFMHALSTSQSLKTELSQLQKLSEVHLETKQRLVESNWDAGKREEMTLTKDLFLLQFYHPRLSSLHLTAFYDCLDGYEGEISAWSDVVWPLASPPLARNLARLNIDSWMAPTALCSILSRTPVLNDLFYFCYMPISDSAIFDCTALREAIESIRLTLEVLQVGYSFVPLTTEDDHHSIIGNLLRTSRGSLGSLRDFSSLKSLDIDLAVLFGERYREDGVELAHLVPDTIQNLIICTSSWDYHQACDWGIYESMQAIFRFLIVEEKKAPSKGLEHLVLRAEFGSFPHASTLIEKLETLCKWRGIECTIIPDPKVIEGSHITEPVSQGSSSSSRLRSSIASARVWVRDITLRIRRRQ